MVVRNVGNQQWLRAAFHDYSWEHPGMEAVAHAEPSQSLLSQHTPGPEEAVSHEYESW